MKKNITNKILMVRPISFAFNEQTAVNNHYQKRDNKPVQEIQNKALIEFDNMVEKLKKVGIDVKVIPSWRGRRLVYPRETGRWQTSRRDR